MKIQMICKTETVDNMDEHSIAYGLAKLGHEVTMVPELRQKRRARGQYITNDCDAYLFFKWEEHMELRDLKHPSFFWYFDLVSSQEDSLASRMATRREWMRRVNPYISAGFCTDGDWVRQNPDRQYFHLMQGADELNVGFGQSQPGYAPILFTGMINHGQKRADHIHHLQERWGDKFEVLGNAGPNHRIHGCKLKDRLASSKIVIAPANPISPHYHSNRAYLSLGFGAFLLHPDNETIREHYESGKEIQLYSSWEELDDLIEYYLKDEHESERQRLMQAGYERTLKSNLYRHRCEELVKIIQERI